MLHDVNGWMTSLLLGSTNLHQPLHEKINPKDFRVVSSDYGKPRLLGWNGSMVSRVNLKCLKSVGKKLVDWEWFKEYIAAEHIKLRKCRILLIYDISINT